MELGVCNEGDKQVGFVVI